MQSANAESGQYLDELWETRSISIEGMTCENCVRAISRSLRKVSGVKEVRVDLPSKTAFVTFDVTKADMAAICRAVIRGGYKPEPQGELQTAG